MREIFFDRSQDHIGAWGLAWARARDAGHAAYAAAVGPHAWGRQLETNNFLALSGVN